MCDYATTTTTTTNSSLWTMKKRKIKPVKTQLCSFMAIYPYWCSYTTFFVLVVWPIAYMQIKLCHQSYNPNTTYFVKCKPSQSFLLLLLLSSASSSSLKPIHPLKSYGKRHILLLLLHFLTYHSLTFKYIMMIWVTPWF